LEDHWLEALYKCIDTMQYNTIEDIRQSSAFACCLR